MYSLGVDAADTGTNTQTHSNRKLSILFVCLLFTHLRCACSRSTHSGEMQFMAFNEVIGNKSIN